MLFLESISLFLSRSKRNIGVSLGGCSCRGVNKTEALVLEVVLVDSARI